jgi:hypothetical protein
VYNIYISLLLINFYEILWTLIRHTLFHRWIEIRRTSRLSSDPNFFLLILLTGRPRVTPCAHCLPPPVLLSGVPSWPSSSDSPLLHLDSRLSHQIRRLPTSPSRLGSNSIPLCSPGQRHASHIAALGAPSPSMLCPMACPRSRRRWGSLLRLPPWARHSRTHPRGRSPHHTVPSHHQELPQALQVSTPTRLGLVYLLINLGWAT